MPYSSLQARISRVLVFQPGLLRVGTGGTYYPLGGALAAALPERIPGLVTTAQTGNASVANSNLIARRAIESAFIQNNVANWAYTGTGFSRGSGP